MLQVVTLQGGGEEYTLINVYSPNVNQTKFFKVSVQGIGRNKEMASTIIIQYNDSE